MMYYEILFGQMPYYANSPTELYNLIIDSKLKFP